MPRPKGSKNESTITQEETARLQAKINELEKTNNSYAEVQTAFVDGFITDIQQNLKVVKLETLQLWFNNPDKYIQNISNLLTYYYIVDGSIFQLYNLIFSLPELNYKITTLTKTSSYKKDISKIKQYMEKEINHKELTRDLLVQLAHDGTAIGTWLGGSENPYFYTFDNLSYIYPYGRYRNKGMVGVIDLAWIDTFKSDVEKEQVYFNLSPLVTKEKYDAWKKCNDSIQKKELQYIILPSDRTLVGRLNTLNRNQRMGIPMGTQALFDIQHKQKMKDLERAVADKIIRSIAVLKFKGKDDNDIKVKEGLKKEVFAKVKKALTANENSDKSSLSVIGLPDFASFEYPEIKNGDKILAPDKYEATNFDISSAIGISSVLTNGQTGNYASAKLNLDMLYKRIGSMLEIIEVIYNQLLIIILGDKKAKNYVFTYDKGTPLEKSKKIESLLKLTAMGYSVSAVLDELGVNSEDYFENSFYEIEVLKLRERIIVPQNTNTTSSKDSGAPTKSDTTNDNTIGSTGNDSNNTPSS